MAASPKPQHIDTWDPRRWFEWSSAAYLAETKPIAPADLPVLYRGLLSHAGSMTTRLEEHFGGCVMLHVMRESTVSEWYARWSALVAPGQRCAAIVGVSLEIAQLRPALRKAVVQGRQPLGRLLSAEDVKVKYESVPLVYIEINPTAQLQGLLQMTTLDSVFGRRTELRKSGQKIGDIIELLPRYELQTVGPRPANETVS